MLKRDPNGYYLFKQFLKYNVIAAFSDRRRNLGFLNNPLNSLKENRKKFLKPLGINYRLLVCTKQPHKDRVKVVSKTHLGKGALSYQSAISDVDSLITDLKSAPLAVFTADCPSIFLYDIKNHAIGLVHAGWQGTARGITRKTVLKMEETFKTKPQNLLVGFGPAIRACCYEVGGEFRRYFREGLFSKKGKLHLDLVRINRKQLKDLGVKAKNILDSHICTSCENQTFFSYRREGSSAGRMLSLICLK